jgi:gluconolactonase
MRQVATGLGFIEGPVATTDGAVFVADLISGWILKVDVSSGHVDRFANVKGSPNGLAAGPDGALYVCNSGGMSFNVSPDGLNTHSPHGRPPHAIAGCIQRVTPDGKVDIVYDRCGDYPLLAPNDLVFDARGNFYFTDAGRHHNRTADLGGIYFARSDGSRIVELVHDPMLLAPPTHPNGIGLSPDGTRLYVAETITGRLWAWDITEDGVLTSPPNAISPQGPALLHGEPGFSLFDSLAVDGDGFICVATLLKGGISVISPNGGVVDYIDIPDEPYVTNICFGDPDLGVAYVTGSGRGVLWEIAWPRQGLRPNFSFKERS